MLQAKTLNGFEMAGDPPKVRVDMCERPLRLDHEKISDDLAPTALRLVLRRHAGRCFDLGIRSNGATSLQNIFRSRNTWGWHGVVLFVVVPDDFGL
jgi:hypothetical protein